MADNDNEPPSWHMICIHCLRVLFSRGWIKWRNARTRQTGHDFKISPLPGGMQVEHLMLSEISSRVLVPGLLFCCVATWEFSTSRRHRPIVTEGRGVFRDALHTRFLSLFGFARRDLLSLVQPTRQCHVCNVDINIYRITRKKQWHCKT